MCAHTHLYIYIYIYVLLRHVGDAGVTAGWVEARLARKGPDSQARYYSEIVETSGCCNNEFIQRLRQTCALVVVRGRRPHIPPVTSGSLATARPVSRTAEKESGLEAGRSYMHIGWAAVSARLLRLVLHDEGPEPLGAVGPPTLHVSVVHCTCPQRTASTRQ